MVGDIVSRDDGRKPRMFGAGLSEGRGERLGIGHGISQRARGPKQTFTSLLTLEVRSSIDFVLKRQINRGFATQGCCGMILARCSPTEVNAATSVEAMPRAETKPADAARLLLCKTLNLRRAFTAFCEPQAGICAKDPTASLKPTTGPYISAG